MSLNPTSSSVGHDDSARPQPLQGKSILVTGASQGIGATAAIALGQAGATVALLARNEMKLNRVYDEIERLGGPEPILIPMDLLKADDNTFYELRNQLGDCFQGRLEGFIHCAATLGPLTPLANYNMQTWQSVMQLNAESFFRLCHSLYPLLDSASQAKVLGFTDRLTHNAYWGAYATSKSASERMLQLWADELENTSKIQCHLIYPGPRRTGLRAAAYPAENPIQVPDTQALGAAFVKLFTEATSSFDQDWSKLH